MISVFDWWPFSKQATWWMGITSGVMFIATLLAIPILVARIPADYFTRDRALSSRWFERHPAVRITILVLKNLLGVLLVPLGIVLSIPLVPGQGLLTLLFGVMLLDFPKKREFEMWLVKRRGVSGAVNWLREKAKQPPLEFPPDAEKSAEGR